MQIIPLPGSGIAGSGFVFEVVLEVGRPTRTWFVAPSREHARSRQTLT